MLLLLAAAWAARANGQNVEGQIIAAQYGEWRVQGYAPDTYKNFVPTSCRVQGGASFFAAFAAGSPVKIVDGNPSRTEVVVPTTAISNNSECSITISPANHHEVPFYLTSATGGLQEAINANLAMPGTNTIILNNEWYRLGGSAATIASVQGSANLGLVDVTQVPTVWYHWNGTRYAAVVPPGGGGAATQVNDLFANNASNTFQDLYHFYATSPAYTAANAIAAAKANGGSVTIQPGAGHTPFPNDGTVKVTDNRTDIPAEARSVKEFGAQCDLRNVYGTLTAGSSTVSINPGYGGFTPADTGKTLVAVGTTAAGLQTAFEPTITYVNASTATLSTPSPMTIAVQQQFDLGHDDTGNGAPGAFTGLAGALAAQQQNSFANNIALTIPVGNCLTHTQTQAPQEMHGQSVWLSQITGFPGEDVFNLGNGGQHVNLHTFTINTDYRIDTTQPWQICNTAGCTMQTPNDRPLMTRTPYANNPLGPGWIIGASGGGASNGVASVANGSNQMTVASGETPPAVGEQVMFPYTIPTFVGIVAAVAGQVVTFGSGQNYTGASSSQQEWFAGSSIQTAATAISSAQSMPFTVTLNNSIAPSPLSPQSNVAPWGMVQIDGEDFLYVGYSKLPPYSITLTARAQNGTSAGAHAAGAYIAPLNQEKPSAPWPVIPTVNSGGTTPFNARFYPGFFGGNFAFAFPINSGVNCGGKGAWYQSTIRNLLVQDWPTNQINNVTFNNTSGDFYFVGLPYSTQFRNLNLFGNYGIAEGLPPTDTHDYATCSLTADGTSWDGISIHSGTTGFSADFIAGGENGYSNFNAYGGGGPSTPGGSGVNFTGGYDDQNGNLVQLASKSTFSNFYEEPGNTAYGNAPLWDWEATTMNWTDVRYGGGGESYIGGQFQHFTSGNIDGGAAFPNGPVINFGMDNVFDSIELMGASPNGNVYGTNGFLDWGSGTVATSTENINSTPFGPYLPRDWGAVEPSHGQTNEAFNTGNLAAPYLNSNLGLIAPWEFNSNTIYEPSPMSVGSVVDVTSPITQRYTACNVGTSPAYTYCSTTRFNENGISIGPGQRLAAGKYLVNVGVKQSSGAAQTFGLRLLASCGGTDSFVLNNLSVPISTTWTNQSLGLIDLGPYSGCYLGFAALNTSTTPTQEQFGYLDLAPLAQQSNAEAVCTMTPTGGQSCWTTGAGAPSGSCTTGSLYTNQSGSPDTLYVCKASAWVGVQ
ncbi:MAG TPA: hypothetical protein VGR96_15765 [Acidobacteriaceae bacterium]|nr:hypothetical protein [Acidobacteriaceae bacterium]